MQLVLTLLFCACIGAPVFVLLRHSSLAARACVLVVAAVLCILARTAVDPLAFGIRQVDGALQGGACGPGLRPSR
jgi:hypothetical protein